MGSTRFFKVARVRSDEGLIVVKVFVKHDPSLPLETHAERLEFIKRSLSNAVNCLPFQRVVVCLIDFCVKYLLDLVGLYVESFSLLHS